LSGLTKHCLSAAQDLRVGGKACFKHRVEFIAAGLEATCSDMLGVVDREVPAEQGESAAER
jgi:hypothetical protein